MISIISVEHASVSYSAKPVLQNICLEFYQGDIVSLLGPNGSGKTTLLKALLGLLPLKTGQVKLEGQALATIPAKQLARRIAYVPQVHRISFAYRVIDVVLMGRMPHKPFFFSYSPTDRELALAALEKLSIAHLQDRPYTDISGGERQLTLIARALTQGADIFIMDEPVNGLDYGNQIRLLAQIDQLATDGFTFIKTTHFPDHALWVSDRVVMLKEGRVIADGKATQVIDAVNLQRLYGAQVSVLEIDGGGRICVPQSLGRPCRCHKAEYSIAKLHRAA